MKKTIILLSTVMASSLVFAQVGVNTSSPTSTLDVTAKNVTGTTTNVDGLLVPRVDRQRAQSMQNVPTSTIIYVNSVATGTQTGTAVNIDTMGHYFYDGTVWMKLNTSAGVPPSVQFYDWLKTGDAQPTASGDNSVNIYHIGGNVGIGTNAPVGRLHIVNPTNGSEAGNDFLVDDESPIAQIPGMVFRRSNAGANLAIDNMIGAIVFNPKINGTLSYNGSGIRSFYRGNGTNMLNNLIFNINANQEAMRIDENGNVGVGITAPTNTLDVNGTARVRSMSAVASGVAVTPVFSDANGVLVKASPSTVYQQVTSNTSSSVASGASATLISLAGAFYYKVSISNSSACGFTSIAEFYIIANTAGGAINAIGGVGAGGSSAKPTFTQSAGSNVIAVSWTGMSVCSDGGDSTAYNYTLTITGSNTLTITNNGNISKQYFVILTKLT